MIGDNYLKWDNFITLLDVDLHVFLFLLKFHILIQYFSIDELKKNRTHILGHFYLFTQKQWLFTMT